MTCIIWDGIHVWIAYYQIIISITIEIASAVIILVGVAYLIRFFRMQRYTIDPLIFRICVACLGFFTVGWMIYLVIRIRHYILRLSRSPEINKAG